MIAEVGAIVSVVSLVSVVSETSCAAGAPLRMEASLPEDPVGELRALASPHPVGAKY